MPAKGTQMTLIAQFLLLCLACAEERVMNVSIGERWLGFVDEIVKSGRYGSASEVVREGLRLVEEREVKLRALRDSLNAAIAEGGEVSDEDVAAALEERAAALTKAVP
jgi:antitoxin ParD1/3/4